MLLGPLALDLQAERWRRRCRRNWPSERHGHGNLPAPVGFLVLSFGFATASLDIWTFEMHPEKNLSPRAKCSLGRLPWTSRLSGGGGFAIGTDRVSTTATGICPAPLVSWSCPLALPRPVWTFGHLKCISRKKSSSANIAAALRNLDGSTAQN